MRDPYKRTPYMKSSVAKQLTSISHVPHLHRYVIKIFFFNTKIERRDVKASNLCNRLLICWKQGVCYPQIRLIRICGRVGMAHVSYCHKKKQDIEIIIWKCLYSRPLPAVLASQASENDYSAASCRGLGLGLGLPIQPAAG